MIDQIVEISKDMKLKTIYGHVASNNYKMIKMCTKKGFKIETSYEETAKVMLDLS